MIDPTTFLETDRKAYGRALIGAGIATGLGALFLVIILTWGGWPAALYPQIVEILGKALLGAGVVMTLVIIFLGLGGPVRKLKATIWKATIETEGD